MKLEHRFRLSLCQLYFSKICGWIWTRGLPCYNRLYFGSGPQNWKFGNPCQICSPKNRIETTEDIPEILTSFCMAHHVKYENSSDPGGKMTPKILNFCCTFVCIMLSYLWPQYTISKKYDPKIRVLPHNNNQNKGICHLWGFWLFWPQQSIINNVTTTSWRWQNVGLGYGTLQPCKSILMNVFGILLQQLDHV